MQRYLTRVSLFDSLIERYERSPFSAGFLFVLPTLLVMAVLLVYPVIRTAWLSFHTRRAGEYIWVGLDNYVAVFQAGWFDTVMLNTVLWTGITVTFQFIIGIGAAVLLNTHFKGRRIVRGLMIIPWVTPGIVAAIIWSWMYDPTFGIFNRILVDIGLMADYRAWLSDPGLALYGIIIAGIWKGFPFSMVMYLAGLQGIDQQLYRAAQIDGAPKWAQFWHITLPQLIPIIKVTVLLTTIWTFNYFVLVYAMTRGGPAGSSDILPNRVYLLAFREFNFGVASALAMVMFLILMVFLIFYIRLLRRQGVDL